MASLFRLSLVPAIALGTLMVLSGCSSYTTGYYPGRHYGNGVRQHYTNDKGNNVGYTINTRTTGSRAGDTRHPNTTVHYNRAPNARGGYAYSPGVYVADVRGDSFGYTTIGITTYGRRGYRNYPGHYGFGRGGYDTYSYSGFGYSSSGYGFGVHNGYYGGAHGGHYGGHYAGHGSHSGHGGGHGSHNGHSGHGHGGAPAPAPAP